MWSHTDFLLEDYEIWASTETATYTPEGGSVVGYSHQLDRTPSPEVFKLTSSSSGIKLEPQGALNADGQVSLIGLYPINNTNWLVDYVEQTGDDWADVPDGSRMVEFQPNFVLEEIYTVTCTCDWVDSLGTPKVATTTLKIVIWQHQNINRDILKAKVREEIRI